MKSITKRVERLQGKIKPSVPVIIYGGSDSAIQKKIEEFKVNYPNEPIPMTIKIDTHDNESEAAGYITADEFPWDEIMSANTGELPNLRQKN